MKIVDNRIVKYVPFGKVQIGDVFCLMENDAYQAATYMRIPEVADDSYGYVNAIQLNTGDVAWFEGAKQVERLNVVLRIESKGE